MTRVAGAIFVLLVSFLVTPVSRAIEDTWDYSVQADCVVEVSPPKITLSWPQDTNGIPASYTVYRKAPAATAWGVGTTLPGRATVYVDTGVALGRAYEYRIVKVAATYTGYGYVQTGIDVPLVEDRGTVVLIVDRTYAANLATELVRLQEDLVGDGWTVRRHDVGRTDPVASVKRLIQTDYETDPLLVKAVFLFGHVPVPYSGKLNPDNHPDHVGAWPADVYYGDMHGEWTDRSVDFRQTLNTDPIDAARLTNLPGDGKFDQSTIPGAVELEVGRVDLANLPSRSSGSGASPLADEEKLLRQYLDKDHNFRHRAFKVPRRAIVGDYFGVRGGEAFSASGYRSFAPLVGAENIANFNLTTDRAKGRWMSTLAAHDYLLAYGCGPGSYATVDGLGHTGPAQDGSTADLAGNKFQAVFTLIFGSWLGDWDHEDDLMRSILAAPGCSLATAWSGRPHWFVHPMGLGETIGYAARLTQNNTDLYQNQINSSANLIHIALMGDPTLRLHPVAPVSAFGGATTADAATLAWMPSPDRVIGYQVYRAASANAPFIRLTDTPTSGTSFVDSAPLPGAIYMVRAVKLENTPSGSYYNASQGIFWTSNDNFARTDAGNALPPLAALSATAPNPRASALSPRLAAPSGFPHPAPAVLIR
jgi:hypothetical protein